MVTPPKFIMHPEACKNPPLLYLYFYKILVEKFGFRDQIILTQKIIEEWSRHIHNVPRKYIPYVLKEMEGYRFLRRVDNLYYLICGEKAKKRLARLNKYWLW